MAASNKSNKEIEAQKKIDHFLSKNISKEEKEAFWAWLFDNPSFYDQLVFTATLKNKLSEVQYSKVDLEGSKEQANEAKVSYIGSYTKWALAAAAVLTLVIGINQLRVISPQDPNILVFQDSLTYIQAIDIFEMESLAALRSDEIIADDELTGSLDMALMLAFQNDKELALESYLEIIRENPDDPRTEIAYMNAGILYYNLRMYEESAELLLELAEKSDDDLRIQKAWWYRANALLILGEIEDARDSFHMAYGFEGPFKREAFRQLRILDSYIYGAGFEDISPYEIDP